MEKGKIIFLHGVSSSGKTTLAKALQERLQEPYYWFSIDSFLHMVSMNRLVTSDGRLNGAVLNKVYQAFHHTIRSFSDMGMHCIVDTVYQNTPGIDHNYGDFVKQLDGCDVFMVYVHCPPEELRRREEKRGDRPIGQGESQLSILQHRDIYDIALDTSVSSTKDAVDMILDAFAFRDNFKAFAMLVKLYESC